MRNEGTLDRALRGVAGLVLLALAWLVGLPPLAEGWALWLATIGGIVLVATAVTGFCPAYRLLGLKTCEDC
jgi:hypothetical protein